MTTENEVAARYVRAVVKMLLEAKALGAGTAITAGGRVDLERRNQLACSARESNHDLVHLSFDHADGGYHMVGIHIFLPRGIAVFTTPDCRLSLIGQRVVIMPLANRIGHYVPTPTEVIHKPTKPKGWKAGIERAERRLAELVERGVDLDSRISLHAFD